jgi:hypothetical protein
VLLLGHKQIQTTARYVHLIGQPLLEASEKISGEIMKKKKESINDQFPQSHSVTIKGSPDCHLSEVIVLLGYLNPKVVSDIDIKIGTCLCVLRCVWLL